MVAEGAGDKRRRWAWAIPIQRKLFYSHFLAVVLVSGSIGSLFYSSAVDSLFGSLQARLKYSAALLSRAVDADEVAAIRARDDAALPAYGQHLQMLRDFQASNKDIAFIYVMRREDDGIFFVVDSDPSPAQALPGQAYPEAPATLRLGFDGLSVDEKITSDQWGAFLSGYAPLKNGRGKYLVGIDMRADEVARKFAALRVTGVISLFLSVLLAYLFSAWLARQITKPIRLFATRSREIAGGILGGQVEVRTRDELEELASDFNLMSRGLADSHDQVRAAMAALEQANVTLEERVAQRTASLARLNEQLVAEVQERTRAQEALARVANTDYLTGLLNRPAILKLLEQEAARVRRSKRTFSLILADLDHFKEVNDVFGHDFGDHVLVHAAQLLRQQVRQADAVARWGGDELLVFMPETPADGALELAQRIGAAFSGHPHVVDGRTVKLGLSMGLSSVLAGEPLDDCIRRADVALYQAKSAGRGRTVRLD